MKESAPEIVSKTEPDIPTGEHLDESERKALQKVLNQIKRNN